MKRSTYRNTMLAVALVFASTTVICRSQTTVHDTEIENMEKIVGAAIGEQDARLKELRATKGAIQVQNKKIAAEVAQLDKTKKELEQQLRGLKANMTFETAPTLRHPIFGYQLGCSMKQAIETMKKHATDWEKAKVGTMGEGTKVIYYDGFPGSGEKPEVTLMFVKDRLVMVGAKRKRLGTWDEVAAITEAIEEKYNCRFVRGNNPYGFSAKAKLSGGITIDIQDDEIVANYMLLGKLLEKKGHDVRKDKYKDL